MAKISAININDAVQKVKAYTNFGYLAHDNMWDASHCPMLHNRDKKSVPTYKDWALLLAGRPKTQSSWYSPLSHYAPTNNTGRFFDTTRCMAVFNDPYGDTQWGRTIRPDGKDGKPIAETKPLDEYFFYYPNQGQSIHDWYSTSGLNIEAMMIQAVWHNTAWADRCIRGVENGATAGYDNTGNPFKYSVYLEPGCYAARIEQAVTSSYVNMYFIAWWYNGEATPPAQSTWLNTLFSTGVAGVSCDVFLQNRNYDTYCTTTNCIFFIDQPVYVCFTWWNGSGVNYSNCRWWIQLFRFTPPPSVAPGYWNPKY